MSAQFCQTKFTATIGAQNVSDRRRTHGFEETGETESRRAGELALGGLFAVPSPRHDICNGEPLG